MSLSIEIEEDIYKRLNQVNKRYSRCVKSGVYILKYSETTIKIGMSSDIERRLKSYQGYDKEAQQAKCLLRIYSQEYKNLEKICHEFASKDMERYGNFEVFKCTNQTTFINNLLSFLLDTFVELLEYIQTFSVIEEQKCEKKSSLSNIYHNPTKQSFLQVDGIFYKACQSAVIKQLPQANCDILEQEKGKTSLSNYCLVQKKRQLPPNIQQSTHPQINNQMNIYSKIHQVVPDQISDFGNYEDIDEGENIQGQTPSFDNFFQSYTYKK